MKQQYCLPGEPSGEFVFHMEDVLEVYTRPYMYTGRKCAWTKRASNW